MTAALPIERPKMALDFTSSHTTYRNAQGDILPGVTTVLGILNKPALLHWAWKLGREGKSMDRTRQTAADVGTVAHALAEAHLRDMDLEMGSIAPDILAPAQRSFARFLELWNREGLSVVSVELEMVSERWQVGGTLDVLAKRGDALVLWDLKTSKAIYDEMLIQVAAYAEIYEETTGDHIPECWIVRIGKESSEDLELRRIDRRLERVAAFEALAHARRALKACGMKV